MLAGLAACTTTNDAKVLAAKQGGLPPAPAHLTKRCPSPDKKIEGKDYRALFADALVWGNCADKKQQAWISFYGGLVKRLK